MKNLLGSILGENVEKDEIIYVTEGLTRGIQDICDKNTVNIVAGNIFTYMECLGVEDSSLLNKFYNDYKDMCPKQFIEEAKELLQFIKDKYKIEDNDKNTVTKLNKLDEENNRTTDNNKVQFTLKDKKKKILEILNSQMLSETLSDRNKFNIIMNKLKDNDIDFGIDFDSVDLNEINILLDSFKLQLNSKIYNPVIKNISNEDMKKIDKALEILESQIINGFNEEQELKPLFNFNKLNQGAKEIMSSTQMHNTINVAPQEEHTKELKEKKKRKHYTCNICKDPKCPRNPGDKKVNCINHKDKTVKNK